MHKIQHCKKCLSCAPQKNSCRECRHYQPSFVDWPRKEKEFKDLVDSYRNTGGRGYDFLVGLTGGKDSSFVLYYMTKILNAKVLAFTFDNGLIRDFAWENIENAVKATAVDHKIYRWDEKVRTRIFQATFKATGQICTTCYGNSTFYFPYLAALENEIPVIISGLSIGQIRLDFKAEMPDSKMHENSVIEAIKLYDRFWSVLIDGIYPKNEREKIKDHLLAPLTRQISHLKSETAFPVIVHLSKFLNWSELFSENGNLFDVLRQNIGWKSPSTTFMHTSCILEGLFKYRNNQILEETAYMVRGGYVNRDEGIEDLNKMMQRANDKHLISEFCRFIQISEKQCFNRINKINKKLLFNFRTVPSLFLIRRFFRIVENL